MGSSHSAARRETSAPAGNGKPSLTPPAGAEERKAQLDAHAVNGLPGVEIAAGAQRRDLPDLVAEQQVGGATGNVEEQHFLAEQLLPFGGEQSSGGMPLLMGRVDEWDAPRSGKSRGCTDARQEAGHIASLHGAGLLRNAHRRDLRQVELPAQFLQHFGQSGGVVEQRIALAEAQLALLDRKKPFLCTNNLSGCVKNCQRGCIIACVDAQCIAAHGSSDAASSAVSKPCSRATVPSRPLTNW